MTGRHRALAEAAPTPVPHSKSGKEKRPMIQLGLFSFYGVLVAAWKGAPVDDRIAYAQYTAGGGWTNLGWIPGNSSVGPALTYLFETPSLYAAWKGEAGITLIHNDQRLFFSSITLPGDTPSHPLSDFPWAPQQQIPGAASLFGPSLAVVPDYGLVAIWAGGNGDQPAPYGANTLWVNSAPFNEDGSATTFGESESAFSLYGASSQVGASLTVDYTGMLYIAWNDAEGNNSVYYTTAEATYDGQETSLGVSSNYQLLPGISSVEGPSLSSYGSLIYAAWRDAASGNLYFSGLPELIDNLPAAPVILNGVQATSSDRPAIAESEDSQTLYMIWKNAENEAISFASYDGSTWTGLGTIPGAVTGTDPTDFEILFPRPLRFA
jgi:hypothetical protein